MVNYRETSNDDVLFSKQLHRYLTIKEAAALLKVSQKTIRRWDAAGKIICSRTPGNHRRIPMSEVVRLQARQNIPPLRDPNLKHQNPNLEPPKSSPPKVSSSHDPLPWRHDMRALKAQLKVLHYLLMNSLNSNANLTVLKELMEKYQEEPIKNVDTIWLTKAGNRICSSANLATPIKPKEKKCQTKSE